MNRRDAVVALLALGAPTAPFSVCAQTPHVRRIGVLLPNAYPTGMSAFRKRLEALGWIEGKNLSIEFRHADDRNERFPVLAKELVVQKIELIATISTPGALAAKAATTSIPIVFALVADPVGSGLVASLARPGGNVTGVSNLAIEIAPKQLELLKALVPKLKRVAFLNDPSNAARPVIVDSLRSAAERAGVTLVIVDAPSAEEIDAAFAKAAREHVAAMVVPPSSLYLTQIKRIVQLATRYKIATAHQNRSAVAAGALVSYGIDFIDGFARTAVYVDKILKGAKPADLPVEQADRFETFINRSAAKALGLTIPQSVLVRVDEVIE